MKNNFAVFIMVYGRPDKMWTYHTLRKAGYTGKIYLVGDDTDETIEEYKEKWGDELIVFNKKEAALDVDAGDNSGDLRSTLFAANKVFDLAEERDIKYFCLMCDDYTNFRYRFIDRYITKGAVKNLDRYFEIILDYYKSINVKSIAFAQGGDFIGGESCGMIKNYKHNCRKVMNSFICSTDRRFKFMGRMNEDVTTYVNLGSRGDFFLTLPQIGLEQMPTQAHDGGLTELYVDMGTYVKSFFSVMYNPSNVEVNVMGFRRKRIHHRIKWRNTVPLIIEEKHKKTLQNRL